MRTTLPILRKIFTRQFYIQNTGFFFILFYLLFGLVDGGNLLQYHLSLMLGFLGNYMFLLLVLLLWTLYALKCTGFVMKVLHKQEYNFLYATMGSMEKRDRMKAWVVIHTGIYMPLLVYAGIAVCIACLHHYYVQAVIVVLFNIGMCIWPLALYERKLLQPDVAFFTGHLQSWINKRFTKPPVLFFIYEMITQYPRRIFSTKLFSVGVLWLTFFLMKQGDYFDLRGLQLGVMLAVLLHLQLMNHHRVFDDTYLNFMENLPVPLYRHYLRMIVIYVLLFLPEMVMIIVNAYTKTDVAGMLTVFCTAWSLLVFFRTLLYFPKINPEKHVRWVLITSFIVLFMILGKVTWPAILLLQAVTAMIFFTRYRTYEPYIEAES